MLIPGVGPISYNAYRWNSPAKMTLPGGSTTEYTYDPLMRVKAILAKDPGQNQVLAREYQYSAAGNITSKNTEHGAYTYQYDALYRLTQVDNPTLPAEAYTYDALGNRLTAAGIPGEWAYNANNELLGYGSKTFNYDLNGNMTTKADGGQGTTYIYDVEDRLVSVESGSSSVVAEYYYDPFGRRLWKDIDGIRTYFVYCDEGLVGEYDASGAELRTYGWAPQSQWGTDPFFVKIGSQYYWYQNDHQGTPQKLITSSGQVVWSATYDSFGNAQIGVEVITNNLRFPGQYYDAETGLHYNLNRYYDPATGRYLRTDPYGEGLNLYAYCFNNPVNLIDPRGLCAAKYIGVQFYYSLWHFADQFNRLVFFPLMDLLSLPDQALDWATQTTPEERMAFAASIPYPVDDVMIGGIAAAGKLPRVARMVTGYSSAFSATRVTLNPRIIRLAEANIVGSGKTVLGHLGYVEKAKRSGASYFDIGDTWNRLSDAEKWAANRHFLDKIAEVGDRVYLSVPKTKINPDSWLVKEVTYLTQEKGYRWINQWSLEKR